VPPAVSTGASFTFVTLIVEVTALLVATPSLASQVTVRGADDGFSDVLL
jgi:hypothetical protein